MRSALAAARPPQVSRSGILRRYPADQIPPVCPKCGGPPLTREGVELFCRAADGGCGFAAVVVSANGHGPEPIILLPNLRPPAGAQFRIPQRSLQRMVVTFYAMALVRSGWNRLRAARALGVNRETLRRAILRWRIRPA